MVYTESCSFPSSSSYLPEIGLPSRSLARRPVSSDTFADFTASESFVEFSSAYVADASVRSAVRATACRIICMETPLFSWDGAKVAQVYHRRRRVMIQLRGHAGTDSDRLAMAASYPSAPAHAKLFAGEDRAANAADRRGGNQEHRLRASRG